MVASIQCVEIITLILSYAQSQKSYQNIKRAVLNQLTQKGEEYDGHQNLHFVGNVFDDMGDAMPAKAKQKVVLQDQIKNKQETSLMVVNRAMRIFKSLNAMSTWAKKKEVKNIVANVLSLISHQFQQVLTYSLPLKKLNYTRMDSECF